jgi:hypothetical protein
MEGGKRTQKCSQNFPEEKDLILLDEKKVNVCTLQRMQDQS